MACARRTVADPDRINEGFDQGRRGNVSLNAAVKPGHASNEIFGLRVKALRRRGAEALKAKIDSKAQDASRTCATISDEAQKRIAPSSLRRNGSQELVDEKGRDDRKIAEWPSERRPSYKIGPTALNDMPLQLST